jgi:hypothetical protein
MIRPLLQDIGKNCRNLSCRDSPSGEWTDRKAARMLDLGGVIDASLQTGLRQQAQKL